MKKKSILNYLKGLYFNELVFAKQSGFEGVMIPIDSDSELCYLESCRDNDLYNIAEESGWTNFAVINFVNNIENIFDLYEVA